MSRDGARERSRQAPLKRIRRLGDGRKTLPRSERRTRWNCGREPFLSGLRSDPPHPTASSCRRLAVPRGSIPRYRAGNKPLHNTKQTARERRSLSQEKESRSRRRWEASGANLRPEVRQRQPAVYLDHCSSGVPSRACWNRAATNSRSERRLRNLKWMGSMGSRPLSMTRSRSARRQTERAT